MHFLVTGAGGQVGRELRRCRWPATASVTAVDRSDLDISDGDKLAEFLVPPLNAVVNVAAYTNVERAENDREGVYRANAEGPALLAERVPSWAYHDSCVHGLCLRRHQDASLISRTNERRAAQSVRSSKLAGEVGIRARLPHHVILRTASVLASTGRIFVKSMLRLGGERPSLSVVDDQISCPTAAPDIAAAIVRVLERIMAKGVSERNLGYVPFSAAGRRRAGSICNEIFHNAKFVGARRPSFRPIPAARISQRGAPSDLFGNGLCKKIGRVFDIERHLGEMRLPEVVTAILNQGNSK